MFNPHKILFFYAPGEGLLAHAQGVSESLTLLDVGEGMHITAYLFGYFHIYPDDKTNRSNLAEEWGEMQD